MLEAQANTTDATDLSTHTQLKIPANHTYRGQTVVNGTLCDVWWFVATNYPFPEVPPSTHTRHHHPPCLTPAAPPATSGQCVVHSSRPPCSPSHPHGHPTQWYTLQLPPYSPLPKPPHSLTPLHPLQGATFGTRTSASKRHLRSGAIRTSFALVLLLLHTCDATPHTVSHVQLTTV